MKKVVFISHGHPELSKGGAEVASWNLYQALKHSGSYECLYIARTDSNSHGGSAFSVRGDEILFHTHMSDWFNLSASALKPLFHDLLSLLRHYSPDIVHVHHYAQIGIELFAAIRQAVPDTKIVFTIHEFMAICMHNGQMVKKPSLRLCERESPSDCHMCFPERSPGDFFFRKQYILDQLALVDRFISPSHFLAGRYVEWGIDADKIEVIENVLPKYEPYPPRSINAGEKRGKLAFFGQINPYKGLDVLLEAVKLLPAELAGEISLDIHGANLEKQPADVRARIEGLLEQIEIPVTMRGAYDSHQLSGLLAECDWVVIPSIWWENSPVVIQEAIAHGRPLIGSDIGGMKEKIEGIAGLTFQARSPSALARVILEAINPQVFEDWQMKLSVSSAVEQHVRLLDEL